MTAGMPLLRAGLLAAAALLVAFGLFSVISLLIASGPAGAVAAPAPVRFDFVRLPKPDARILEPTQELPPAPRPSAPPPLPEFPDSAEAEPEFAFGVGYDLGGPEGFAGLSGDLAASREAVPVLRVRPLYPPRASSRGIEGWVEVGFTIAATGATADVAVVREEPPGVFGRAAVRAVRKWKYQPQMVDGEIRERTGQRVVIQFELEE